ncbi:glycine oxidase ThiO [Catenulispora sp. NF23]|uniref:glycine oxidase n=2 Tax=Catenulispora pinistramenti TaxID=2705254 RepID=A0ABS5L4T1_9ACTN|nr:glycine oxidase ThiO [Catenulispora pinistramenti]MBS2553232.1 glycine oxidase ThiO [Catenulispora pinistramenti]
MMTMPEPARSDVLIIGGGLIGLATAWRTAVRGLSVTLCDPAPGANASFAAAGMLTPVTELHYGEETLLDLNLASAKRYPSFIAELQEAAGGLDPGYTEAGTLVVAFDGDDREVLADLHLFQQSLGLKAEWLAGSQARRLEPMLAPSVRGGLLVSGDHQVDNRMLLAALFAALEREPQVRIVRSKVAEVTVAGDRATGVVLDDGRALAAEQVVLSAGCWSGQIGGIPPELLPPVRPIKGQILRLAVPEVFRPFVSRTVRYVVRNNQAYLVPRAHGELVLGATVEEQDYDTTVTAGGVYELLRDARELVPGITELPLIETRAALRPGTPDNAPMIGPTALPGLLYATGHYRHGVLLTPATADGMAEILATGEVPEALAPFSPQRFGRPQK